MDKKAEIGLDAFGVKADQNEWKTIKQTRQSGTMAESIQKINHAAATLRQDIFQVC
jgi:hypothetical protein